jgi:guanine nucleotide-binding protein G(i) subunit alpha
MNPLQNSRAIVFFASLSDYFQVAYEDDTTNRMEEQLSTFSKYVGRFIHQVDCILVFNKGKLMAENLDRYPLVNYFPDYTGGSDFNSARDFIANKFLSQLNEEHRSRIIVRYVECVERTSVQELLEEPFWHGEGLRDNKLSINRNS